MNKVVHFELPADNIARAKKFYKETFGWVMEVFPKLHYTALRTTDVDEKMAPKEPGAINGGMFKRGDMGHMITAPTFSVEVDDIDSIIKKIKNAGGLILKEKGQVGDMGFIAYFKDTEGNILSVWEALRKSEENKNPDDILSSGL